MNLARIERTTLRISLEPECNRLLESHALPLCQRFIESTPPLLLWRCGACRGVYTLQLAILTDVFFIHFKECATSQHA